MVLQSRKVGEQDLEKDPLLLGNTSYLGDIDKERNDDDDKYTKKSKRSPPACKLVIGNTLTFVLLLLCGAYFTPLRSAFPWPPAPEPPVPPFVKAGIEQCKIIERSTPSFEPYDGTRKSNDRFVYGTKATWLKNATLWTGEKDGVEILENTDILIDKGMIKKIGSSEDIQAYLTVVIEGEDGDALKSVEEVELKGSWVTPGIVDLHSHLAVDPAPSLEGTDDTNSLKGPVLPWLRSLDGFNTHDAAFNLSISGGVTTMLVLPGSAGNIGGSAFTFKPRWTNENTPQSMQVEPPFLMKNGSWERTRAWRHIKHACGENPHRTFGNTRMDSSYDFRRAYNEGKQLKEKQERWCASPKTQTEPFPDSLEWEVLADAIRGNVKVNIHCYETVDLNDLVRISNEFQFHIAAFHHAHETYLVPDLLKQTYGGAPSVAIFATNARYKRESYRGSEYAPKILADNGLNVVMKSDHPVLDSRYLIFEAAQAHLYGLNYSHALGSVTTHSARAMGLDHRLGYVREGYDADVVVWDSFPLTLGATPKQTYIDGIPQITKPNTVEKPEVAQKVFEEGHWNDEIAETLATRGEPDLSPKRYSKTVVFENVADFHLKSSAHFQSFAQSQSLSAAGSVNGTVVVSDGKITCAGQCAVEEGLEFDVVDLKGGSIAPGYITVGSFMGLMDIRQEESTWDGVAYDPLHIHSDLIAGLVVHAEDGLRFGNRDQQLAYRAGVTTAVVNPLSTSFFSGLSASYSTGAKHPMDGGAILNPAAALHLQLDSTGISVSTKVAVLRRLLQHQGEDVTELQKEVHAVKRGYRRLVVEVNKADVMASLLRLKRDWAPGMQMTFIGAAESWMIADEIAELGVGVVVSPARSFPYDWDSKRIMPGLPISNQSLVSYLASKHILVGIGCREEWEPQNTRYEAGWIYANSPSLTRQDAVDLVSSNLEILLGLNDREENPRVTRDGDEGSHEEGGEESWVAYQGDMMTFEGRVKGVKGYMSDHVDLF